MERIKQALERARSQRDDSVSYPSRSVSARPRKRSHESAPKEEVIVYSQTRMVKSSPEYLQDNCVIYGADDENAAYYSVLRTHVLQQMRANKWRSLGVTSAAEGAGKTLTSVNLAMSIAREVNHTVLLVDLDLKRPRVVKCFNDHEMPGISEYLIDDKPVTDLLFNPGIERLVVLPGSKSLTHSSEILSSPKMVHLVDDLKNRYPSRIVIFDLPPVLACDDVLAFSPYLDAALIVVEEGETSADDLKRTIELLGKTEILGTVLNKSTAAKSYGYGYY